MEERNYQKELFEFEEKKRPAPKLANIFPKDDFAITLSIERLIFVTIGLILAMVVIFALGVEKGRSLRLNAVAAKKITGSPAMTQRLVVKQPIVKKAVTGPAVNKPFMVVIAALLNKENAQAQVAALRSKGFDAYCYQSDKYFLICVGTFPNKESAQATLNSVKRIYKEAYIRSR